jgi:alkylation response protein AidB-like acyl-CoA dehydrogenase
MDFSLNNEQRQMQEAADELFEALGGVEPARRKIDGEEGVVTEVWEQLSESDYTALTVPFEYDGLGDGILYLALILEVAGRVAMPGPYPETAAVGAPLIEALGSEEQKETYLPGIADGNHRTTIALREPNENDPPDGIQLDATKEGDTYTLSGKKTLVPCVETVDTVIVAARMEEKTGYGGVSLFLINQSDVSARVLDSLDKTRPMYELTFNEVIVPESALLSSGPDAGSALIEALDRYEVALSAMLMGAADRAVDLSVDHGTNREQYGHPIGRYQAVKHRTVDMWMDMQASRSLVYAAAWRLANGKSDASRAVSTAKAHLSENAARLFRDDIQNHGGIGFTTDHDAHIYAKQAKSWEHYPRSADFHWERIAEDWTL